MVVQAVAITAQMCQMKDTQHLAHLQWKPGAGPAQLSSHCSRHRGPRPASSCRAKTPLKYTGMGFIIIFRLRRSRDSPWAASKALVPAKGPFPRAALGAAPPARSKPGMATVELPETPRPGDFQFTWAQDGAAAGQPDLCLESKSQNKVIFFFFFLPRASLILGEADPYQLPRQRKDPGN